MTGSATMTRLHPQSSSIADEVANTPDVPDGGRPVSTVRLPADSATANRPQPIYRPGDVDDPAAPLRQALPPPRDGLQHADLGMVSGGMGEEGAARNHADG